MRFAYPVDLEADEDGRIVARCSDVPGCSTDGADRAEALAEIADALEEALAGVITDGRDVPTPSAANGRPFASPGAVIGAKLALYGAMRERRMSKVALATALGVAESEIRRFLDPAHPTKIGRLEKALAHFGLAVVIDVERKAA